MLRQTKYGVLIGRFSPLHSGHKKLIRDALRHCDELLILVGSANSPATIRTPWSYKERVYEINKFVQHEGLNVYTRPLNDYKYQDSQWISDVVATIIHSFGADADVTMFGSHKEDTQYLDWFPQYEYVELESLHGTSGTAVRDVWFRMRPDMFPKSVVEDKKYFDDEKVRFAEYPYLETLNFCCADAIIECDGHVLLIERARAPGRGTYALPGGFKNNNETYLDCAFREVVEETGLKVPEKVLRGSVVKTQLFDDPTRGMGIPRNTLAVHIKIQRDFDGHLPKISPADDATDARWVSIYEAVNEYTLFDDHKAILCSITGTLPVPAYLNKIYK